MLRKSENSVFGFKVLTKQRWRPETQPWRNYFGENFTQNQVFKAVGYLNRISLTHNRNTNPVTQDQLFILPPVGRPTIVHIWLAQDIKGILIFFPSLPLYVNMVITHVIETWKFQEIILDIKGVNHENLSIRRLKNISGRVPKTGNFLWVFPTKII